MNDISISNRGIEFIKEFEGAHTKLSDGRYKSYLDKLAVPNVWTIFTGLTKGVTKDTIWTEVECEARLRKELAICEDAVERLVKVGLNQNEADALISFIFNCGVGAFQTSTLLKLLNQGNRELVPAQLMRWVHAGGKEWAGLVRRRKAEGALFMEPMPESVALPERESDDIVVPQMPQRVEEAPAGNAKDAMRESWTIRGAVLAFLATISETAVEAYGWLTGVARDAGTELTAIKQTVGPFDTILVTMKSALPVLAVIGIVIVVSRRLSAAREGKIG